MLVDWNIVAALAACVAALAAVVTTGILVWQTRSTVRVQTAMQLIAFWQSPPMFPRMRNTAALSLLAYLGRLDALRGEVARGTAIGSVSLDNTAHVNEILDFFESVAFFTKRCRIDPGRVLDEELTYQTFFWPMVNYWVVTKEYINDAQTSEGPGVWEEYSSLMPRLIAKEGREPTVAEAKEYLEEEMTRCSVEVVTSRGF